MSEFQELMKSFSKSRDYVRDFFVYGFKSRDDFGSKSGRTYDNERRKIESWLSGFIRKDYTKKGKNISLAIDSNLLDTNPLYQVWKTKSFTDNDIMLHFFLLDGLAGKKALTIEEITDLLLDDYDVVFDVQMVRRKCNEYAEEGIFIKEKQGKEMTYRLSDPNDIEKQFPGILEATMFYQLTGPFGIVGSTLLDTLDKRNKLFRVKHSFFVHSLEDEVLFQIMQSMREHTRATVRCISSKNGHSSQITGVPLQIFTSTRTGRRFLCMYKEQSKRFTCFRLDSIKEVTQKEPFEEYEEVKKLLRKARQKAWGVSFQNDTKNYLQHIQFTISIQEGTEDFILNRLQREGKGGTITKLDTNVFSYENDVYDVQEMMPWIRSFTGRILSISSSYEPAVERFHSDMKRLYQMYEIETLENNIEQ